MSSRPDCLVDIVNCIIDTGFIVWCDEENIYISGFSYFNSNYTGQIPPITNPIEVGTTTTTSTLSGCISPFDYFLNAVDELILAGEFTNVCDAATSILTNGISVSKTDVNLCCPDCPNVYAFGEVDTVFAGVEQIILLRSSSFQILEDCFGGPSNCEINLNTLKARALSVSEVGGNCERTISLQFFLEHNNGLKWLPIYFYDESIPDGVCGTTPNSTSNMMGFALLEYSGGVFTISTNSVNGISPQSTYTIDQIPEPGGTIITISGLILTNPLPCEDSQIAMYIGATNDSGGGGTDIQVQCYGAASFIARDITCCRNSYMSIETHLKYREFSNLDSYECCNNKFASCIGQLIAHYNQSYDNCNECGECDNCEYDSDDLFSTIINYLDKGIGEYSSINGESILCKLIEKYININIIDPSITTTTTITTSINFIATEFDQQIQAENNNFLMTE